MTPYRQQIFAAPGAQPAGHDAQGIPGDCLRTAVAALTDAALDDVPHFAMWSEWWWDVMRLWARQRHSDFACVIPVDGSIRQFINDPSGAWDGLAIASGPSPRGPFQHVVIVDADLRLVHDPHPSDAGLAEIAETFVYVRPYDLEDHPLLDLALPHETPTGGHPW